MKNLVKSIIIVSAVASLVGCSQANQESLKVHSQKIEAEQVMEDSKVDTTIPVLEMVEKTSIPKIEMGGKSYVVSSKEDMEALLEDNGLRVESYDDNITISYDSNNVKTVALGDVQRFNGLKVNGLDMSMSLSDLENRGAEIDKDYAKFDGVNIYFKDGKIETIMIEL